MKLKYLYSTHTQKNHTHVFSSEKYPFCCDVNVPGQEFQKHNFTNRQKLKQNHQRLLQNVIEYEPERLFRLAIIIIFKNLFSNIHINSLLKFEKVLLAKYSCIRKSNSRVYFKQI